MGLMTKRHAHLYYGLFYLLLCLQGCLSKKINLDLESYDCTHLEPFIVSDTDLVSIIARPRVDVPTRTFCIIRLQAPSNRRFNIYLHDIYITDCGIKLDFFDNDIHLKSPFKSFGCHSSPGMLFSTFTNALTIKLSKLSSAATRYRIHIELATDKGPKLGTDLGNHTKKQSLALTAVCAAVISWLI